MIGLVADGTFRLVSSTCSLEDVVQSIWRDDSITHEFMCTACYRRFVLHADTYHGYANWEPQIYPRPPYESETS